MTRPGRGEFEVNRDEGMPRKKAGQESCEDPIIGGYCGIINLAAAGSGLSES